MIGRADHAVKASLARAMAASISAFPADWPCQMTDPSEGLIEEKGQGTWDEDMGCRFKI